MAAGAKAISTVLCVSGGPIERATMTTNTPGIIRTELKAICQKSERYLIVESKSYNFLASSTSVDKIVSWTRQTGPVWIMGTPLFYSYKVQYDREPESLV